MREWRIALRLLVKRRVLTLAIVSTLTLSIGAAIAMFAVLDAVVLRPLPYPDADRLVAVFERHTRLNQPATLIAAVRLDEWTRAAHSVSALSGSYFENVTDTSGSVPERIGAMRTAPRFFEIFETPAALGRTFTPEEEVFGGPHAIVLSDLLWRTRFGADRSIVGRVLTIADVPREVVGVMPPSFRYPTPGTEAWIPAQAPEALLSARAARFYLGVGRLKPGVALEQATQEIAAIQSRLGEQFPQTDAGWGVSLVPLKEQIVGNIRAPLWLLFGAVLVVLIAACANIAGLLLADATRRELQVAVQFALGATRAAIIRQRMIEGALLSLLGAAGGLTAGAWGLNAIRAVATRLPRANELSLDSRAIVFTVALTAVATLAFALLPALHATSRDVASRLAGHRQIGGRQRTQRVLLAGQVAFAVVLLVGAGLLARSFLRLQDVSPGFDASAVNVFRISAAWSERPENVGTRQQRTLERLQKIPGVIDVALGTVMPAGPDADDPPTFFAVAGRPSDDSAQVTAIRQVSANYFKTLRVPLLSGELCTDDPRVNAPNAALVNRAFVQRFFANENPIGQRIVLRTSVPIIGIVGDAREQSLLKDPQPTMYLCGLTPYYPDPWYFVRVDPARGPDMATIRAAVLEIEPQRAVYAVQTLADVLAESTSQPRLNTALFAFAAAIALVLVVVGMYGLLSQFVADRTREIGLRLALGASKREVLVQIARQSAWVTIAGLMAGMMMAASLARAMAAMVFGISPVDPITFVSVPVFLVILMLVVTLAPAVRAASLDPVAALRGDGQ